MPGCSGIRARRHLALIRSMIMNDILSFFETEETAESGNTIHFVAW